MATAIEDLEPLKPELFHILVALVARPRHGYGIIKEVERETRGRISLEPSPLYRRLKRLLEAGVVEEIPPASVSQADDHDERRRYYALTASGRLLLQREAQRVVRLAENEIIQALANPESVR